MNNSTVVPTPPVAESQSKGAGSLTVAQALAEAYASLCGVQEILREEVDSITQRDPLERLVFEQDAARLFAAELDNARQFMEIAQAIAKREKERRDQTQRALSSGLIIPVSRVGH